MANPAKIETAFTQMMNCVYPIIGAPMFLVSNEDLVAAISEAGGVGTFPALNFRPIDRYIEALKLIRGRTTRPFGVNVIVNKSNLRQREDLKFALDLGVNMIITSLGSPRHVIEDAHKSGVKVFCDVTNLEHALKVQDMGADGVIAVGSGAGGHAGPISPIVLVPWLREKLQIPVIAAGGIAHGSQIAAMLAVGASAVSIGTRFIASTEAQVVASYKQAIIDSSPEDIVLTSRISGTPASVIRTPYVDRLGRDLPWPVEALKTHPFTRGMANMAIHWMGAQRLKESAERPSWKTVWSAGQSVGLVEDQLPARHIVERLVAQYLQSVTSLPGGSSLE